MTAAALLVNWSIFQLGQALIALVALFILAVVFAAPMTWAGKSNGGGGGWGNGQGGGRGHGVPEIDPGMASSAIALLTCGVLILTGNSRRKE